MHFLRGGQRKSQRRPQSDLLHLRQEVRMLRRQQPTDVREEKAAPRVMGIGRGVTVLVVNAVHLRPEHDRGRNLIHRRIPGAAPPVSQVSVSDDWLLRRRATPGSRLGVLSVSREHGLLCATNCVTERAGKENCIQAPAAYLDCAANHEEQFDREGRLPAAVRPAGETASTQTDQIW